MKEYPNSVYIFYKKRMHDIQEKCPENKMLITIQSHPYVETLAKIPSNVCRLFNFFLPLTLFFYVYLNSLSTSLSLSFTHIHTHKQSISPLSHTHFFSLSALHESSEKNERFFNNLIQCVYCDKCL